MTPIDLRKHLEDNRHVDWMYVDQDTREFIIKMCDIAILGDAMNLLLRRPTPENPVKRLAKLRKKRKKHDR